MGGGGGILGGITDAIGLTNYSQQTSAQKASAAAAQYATDASVALARENIAFQKEQMDFQKQQYGDWESVFGSVSKNLGDYYKTLSGDTLAAKQITALNTELAKGEKELQTQLAQRGLSSSGINAAAMTQMALGGATAKASIRASAEEQAVAQKQGFLGLGLGQGTNMLGIQAQQSGNVGSAYGQGVNAQLQGGLGLAEVQSKYANSLTQTNAAMMKDLAGGGMAFGSYKAGMPIGMG